MNHLVARKGAFLLALKAAGAWPPRDSGNLYATTGDLGMAVGAIRRRIIVDKIFEGAPDHVKEFILFHEGAHVLLRHGLWLQVFRFLSLGLAAWPLRAHFEREADRVALAHMRPIAFVNAIHHVYRPPTTGFRGWLYKQVYGGSWQERCARAGCTFVMKKDETAGEVAAKPLPEKLAIQTDGAAAARDRYSQMDDEPSVPKVGY